MFNVVDQDGAHHDVAVEEAGDDRAAHDVVAEVALVDSDDNDYILQVVLELHTVAHTVYVALVVILCNNTLRTQEE